MPTYYTDRASYDAAYRAKQNKRRKIILICILAAAIITDVLIYFLCPEKVTTIINFGGSALVIDKLVFVIAAVLLELAISFVAFVNDEKRLSLIVWLSLLLIISVTTLIKSL